VAKYVYRNAFSSFYCTDEIDKSFPISNGKRIPMSVRLCGIRVDGNDIETLWCITSEQISPSSDLDRAFCVRNCVHNRWCSLILILCSGCI